MRAWGGRGRGLWRNRGVRWQCSRARRSPLRSKPDIAYRGPPITRALRTAPAPRPVSLAPALVAQVEGWSVVQGEVRVVWVVPRALVLVRRVTVCNGMVLPHRHPHPHPHPETRSGAQGQRTRRMPRRLWPRDATIAALTRGISIREFAVRRCRGSCRPRHRCGRGVSLSATGCGWCPSCVGDR